MIIQRYDVRDTGALDEKKHGDYLLVDDIKSRLEFIMDSDAEPYEQLADLIGELE